MHRNAGQGPLAYLTAATYGYDEAATEIAQNLGMEDDQLPAVHPDSKVLLPPEPVCENQTNWPLLTVSKVPFPPPPLPKKEKEERKEKE